MFKNKKTVMKIHATQIAERTNALKLDKPEIIIDANCLEAHILQVLTDAIS